MNDARAVKDAFGATHDLQTRIVAWVRRVFGDAVQDDRQERIRRLVEEAIELAQSEGVGFSVVKRIATRVYSRPPGAVAQEASGVLLTLLAWAEAAGVDLRAEGLRELDRVEALDPEYLRARHNAKAAAGTAMPATVDTALWCVALGNARCECKECGAAVALGKASLPACPRCGWTVEQQAAFDRRLAGPPAGEKA